MKTIYAFGCSVTHGSDLATVNASEENVMGSYPVKIAQALNLECENWAIPGNSNENIFHNFMDTIPNTDPDDIAFVIVGWTSPIRELWKCDGRTWHFIPGWCASLIDITKPFTKVRDPKPRWTEINPRMVSDGEEYLDLLESQYEFLAKYKWDLTEYTKKRLNFIRSVRSYCVTKNIKLIETQWYDSIPGIEIDLTSVGPWHNELRHPNKDEHIAIAEMIIKHYNL